ncbi:hypothetical protein [Aquirufa sp. OSTEICH-129A]
MRDRTRLMILALFVTFTSYSQKFYLGDQFNGNSKEFKLLGISSKTNVSTYKYVGIISDTYYFNRKIGDIVIGVKNGMIVMTIYNLIPESNDIDVPKSTLDLVNASLPFPLAKRDRIYGANIDNMTITISRTKNELTFFKDRIMMFTSVKNSILKAN